ncbi:hypothetical protein [Streptomyces sp. NPDC050535]|uniref:hypothetical protein n=1 Tax=Streptomyces sp. NPDC050535 TaxID=3365626 RepID=UPI00379005DF
MGVFARFLRRSKATEEASTAEAQAGTLTAETAAGVAEEAKGSSETEAEVTAETAGTADTEDVEIPKQQTAGMAADSEAGEGART